MAAFVLGLVGFAFGIAAAGIWLHALMPAETTSLIAAYALLVQRHATWKLRRALNVRRLIRSLRAERRRDEGLIAERPFSALTPPGIQAASDAEGRPRRPRARDEPAGGQPSHHEL